MTRRYLMGQAASIVGLWTQNVTLNLLLWQMSHSPWLLGVLNFLLYCPSLIVPLLFGSRLTPARVKGIMMKILCLSMTISGLLLTSVLLGFISPPFILLIAALAGCISSMELPTRHLLLTSSLQDKSLMYNAVAMNTMVFNLGRMFGPAIAAWSFNHYGAAAGFVISLCGLITMWFAVRSMRVVESETGTRRAGGMRKALRYVKNDHFAMRFLPMLAFMGIFAGSYQSLIPVLAAESFHDTARFTGWFFSSAGIGSLLAALLISARISHQRLVQWLQIAPWSAVLALGGIASSSAPLLTCFCFLWLGLSLTFFSTMINSTLQHHSPPELRGGVVGLYGMSFQGTMPIGNLLVGLLASLGNIMLTFLLMSLMLAVLLGGQWGILKWKQHNPATTE
ncbi:MFS transporter [Erwiniaceae bacterium BAC15a-03b]|uniref:MFS transporter n=1 Tax=Winslowiella arboricola TaxID=2978220 RepID=A0A9J6PNP1_9GAMM|nr:MFS transporter [Winslowiella arboricola]MCU5772504.1 MFS transporter [Winslowiella arboricola]MCU5779026.1 MFS transporter [Winslowiella arboricola]